MHYTPNWTQLHEEAKAKLARMEANYPYGFYTEQEMEAQREQVRRTWRNMMGE